MSLLCLSQNGYGMNPLRRQHQQQHVTFILRVLTSESQIWKSTQIPTLPPNIRRHQLLFPHAVLVYYNNCYVTNVKPTHPAKFEYPMWNIRGGGNSNRTNNNAVGRWKWAKPITHQNSILFLLLHVCYLLSVYPLFPICC